MYTIQWLYDDQQCRLRTLVGSYEDCTHLYGVLSQLITKKAEKPTPSGSGQLMWVGVYLIGEGEPMTGFYKDWN